jgi:hypothetical protein
VLLRVWRAAAFTTTSSAAKYRELRARSVARARLTLGPAAPSPWWRPDAPCRLGGDERGLACWRLDLAKGWACAAVGSLFDLPAGQAQQAAIGAFQFAVLKH